MSEEDEIRPVAELSEKLDRFTALMQRQAQHDAPIKLPAFEEIMGGDYHYLRPSDAFCVTPRATSRGTCDVHLRGGVVLHVALTASKAARLVGLEPEPKG